MGSKFCMNDLCRATTSSEWKKGWGLKSGGYSTLCSNCGSAYEHLAFCDMFHSKESGWRECRMCGKRLHCGCIVSMYLYEYMDHGGISCINCTRLLGVQILRTVQTPSSSIMPNGTLPVQKVRETPHVDSKKRMDGNDFDKGRLMHMTMEVQKPEPLFQSQNGAKIKPELKAPIKELTCLPNLNHKTIESPIFGKPDTNILKQGIKDTTYQAINQTSMGFSLGTPTLSTTSSSPLQFLAGIVEGSEQTKAAPLQQGQKEQSNIPKPIKAHHTSGSESKKGILAPTRIARPPPSEGRSGRNQLLPRYWPRITDQELQKLSGDLKSNITPLFEKVLSASDAGRIGRLVLPKACAEAYFPPIHHSEGIAIRVQDIKGQEWTFQFRFWPNNNSRMYVLEGVTPCIQNMQLQAGDTVTFSRLDPGGKLVMGFRKATNNNADTQDPSNPMAAIAGGSAETQIPGAIDNDTEKNENGAIDDLLQRNVSIPEKEKKKTRNIGPKNKRLLIPSKDALELKVTWEEAQELLRPSPSAKPTVVVIDECEFEEYEEPPVFGKKSFFSSRSTGEHDQWAQCDSCSKWRRLPAHVLLPPKWTCSDNIWDPTRCSCSAPDEINPREQHNKFPRDGNDSKRRRIAENDHNEDFEPSGLDALATVAVLGDNIDEYGELPPPTSSSAGGVGPTTKHPRHRPGCSCIVCIQPPSGKGKHLPSCKCNVCLTVRRRFKTLMLRKKKKQSERLPEPTAAATAAATTTTSVAADGKGNDEPLLLLPNNGAEMSVGLAVVGMLGTHLSENDGNLSGDVEDVGTSKGQLDLNCDPNREDDVVPENDGIALQVQSNNGLETQNQYDHMVVTSTDTKQEINDAD